MDISAYESDGILVGLAKDGERERLETLLKGGNYQLNDEPAIRVAQAMIDKYRQDVLLGAAQQGGGGNGQANNSEFKQVIKEAVDAAVKEALKETLNENEENNGKDCCCSAKRAKKFVQEHPHTAGSFICQFIFEAIVFILGLLWIGEETTAEFARYTGMAGRLFSSAIIATFTEFKQWFEKKTQIGLENQNMAERIANYRNYNSVVNASDK